MYWSPRLSVRGPPVTGWYCQNRRRRSIVGESTVDDRLREKSTVSCRLREKKKEEEEKKRRRRKKYLLSSCCPRPRAVAALARGQFFSRARRRNFSSRGERSRR
ncbi:hypothetical protein BHE74_00047103, partial [Ensete ventricosum]